MKIKGIDINIESSSPKLLLFSMYLWLLSASIVLVGELFDFLPTVFVGDRATCSSVLEESAEGTAAAAVGEVASDGTFAVMSARPG